MKKLVVLTSLSAIITIASTISAADNPQDPPDANRFRCVMYNDDGSCTSMPADCPVTGPAHPNNPSCPEGWTLILAQNDNCTQQLICVD
ncbi:MAG TPA: hypothetical protein VF516_33155 [Kofleriaceae bacterium]